MLELSASRDALVKKTGFFDAMPLMVVAILRKKSLIDMLAAVEDFACLDVVDIAVVAASSSKRGCVPCRTTC